ncbi:efflux RND transporter periplasmic adaptor subunit [Providencia heimbachae]|uniref:Putative Co/Zn/Cd efflux system membrane fusion protein n=1 Tax=Providencia heimbachae ATCC 35613 TaxID=1354272 RepID=A0A1B7JVQ1_9GAMM|nr:efflux RND transporter periplasmic adaptor subunit [Providencia heimbachae]OAT51955.1 putative Co/Zn/Cd efflux system membrane fusion protein [Providencia heimbachae ATCC 35613]SQH15204.1 Multidrug resistance protein MdtE precursor [Providencia heimbachae]
MKIKYGVYVTLLAIITMSGMSTAQENKQDSEAESASIMNLPKVPVAEVIQKNITPSAEFTGYLASPKTVDLRSRVGGRINTINLPEGQLIKKGDLLFQIDPLPFQIALNEAEGQLSQANALALQANRHFDRVKNLVDKGAVSRKDYDDALSLRAANNAQVKSAKAAVENAKLNLSYTQVKAPIAGRVDRALITEGNLVTGGDTNSATRLTTIVSVDPIYAYFDIDEATFHKLSSLNVNAKSTQNTPLPSVSIRLPHEKDATHSGTLNFISNQIDRTTGTVKVRAVLKNEDAKLTPGSFIRAQLPIGNNQPAILIDEQAIGSNQGQSYVLVLDKNNKAEYRQIELGAMVDNLRVISNGLSKGEKIIIKGLVRPGMEVMPNEIPMQPSLMKNTETQQNSQDSSNNLEEIK